MVSGRAPDVSLLDCLNKVNFFDLLQDVVKTREFGEFLSGALAGALLRPSGQLFLLFCVTCDT